ncbi:MerR family transcriptional regulator [Prolixibacteraceae bacterium Z1-6]|uniref:MerR family transcriptional regulator n=1 Tax=Draconibacterium aestuarii TaxID=2998507 RepID=A0A9X3J6C8_9BACT|nr:MerR family transcriptional regulator [Prolixibacteraceae bacterium Z1-6]
MNTEGYSIKDLETLSGIKAHTIRIWEKRYSLLHPERTDTNIRYYTDDDLRHILNVSFLVKGGHKISKVAKWGQDQIKETVLEVSKSKSSENAYIDRLMLSMVNFDNEEFFKILNEIQLRYSLEEMVYTILFSLFKRIGTYWQVGSIFPAQEHFVSHIIRQKIIAEIDKIGLNNKRGQSILFFLPENEMHEISLLFYSYLAHKSGFNVIYLGQFVPFNDLQKLQSHLTIDFVFTAFINSWAKDALENYLVDLKGLFQKQRIFITGWQVDNLNPELPRNVKIVKDYKEFRKFVGA